MKDVLTLEADTYQEVIEIRNRTYMNSLKDYLGFSGALSWEDYTMNISINKAGISSADEYGMPTGSLLWFSKGEPDYYQLISDLGQVENFRVDFSIAGDYLTWLVYYDGDDVVDAIDIFQRE